MGFYEKVDEFNKRYFNDTAHGPLCDYMLKAKWDSFVDQPKKYLFHRKRFLEEFYNGIEEQIRAQKISDPDLEKRLNRSTVRVKS